MSSNYKYDSPQNILVHATTRVGSESDKNTAITVAL